MRRTRREPSSASTHAAIPRGLPARFALALVAVAFGALAFAAVASATAPSFDSTFTCSATPGGSCELSKVAVDEASGDVYVTDAAHDVIDRFNSTGTYLSQIKGSETAATSFSFGGEYDIAIDNSGTATQGNLYVLSEGGGAFYAFEPDSGEPSGFKEIWERGPIEVGGVGGDSLGVGVDASGHPWGADYFGGVQQLSVADGSGVGGLLAADHGIPAKTSKLAFDSAGNMYVNAYHGEIWKYNSGNYTTTALTIPGGYYDVATDSVTGEVYAATEANNIPVWSSAGTPVSGTPFATTGTTTGVTVDGAHGRIYVASSAGIEIYLRPGAAPKPYVRTEGASGQAQHTATIAGKVNPAGVSTTCEVQYSVDTSFSQSQACASGVGSGSGDVSESVTLSGLGTSTEYHYRLVATNANGTTKGVARTFTTLPPQSFALTVVLGGNGAGSVQCKVGVGSFGACAPTYLEGTTVKLKATANAGNVLGGWLGDCEPISATECEITLNEAARVTAVFLTEGTQGSAGPAGPAGGTGPAGSNGTNGSQGAKGDTGATGPQGPAAKVTCVVKKKGAKVKVTCTVKQSASASRVHWRLSRAGHTVRHGAARHGRLQLGALPSGHYRLHVAGQKGSTAIVVS